MNKIKGMFGSNVDQKRKNQNLALIIILLVISLIAINTIFNDEKTKSSTKATTASETTKTSNNLGTSEYTEIEENLKAILEEISGVSEVSVMLTYSSYGKMIPVYDVKEDVNVEENGVDENSKTSKQTVTEKKVAYEEQDSNKEVVVESREAPVVEGAIIVAKGVSNSEISEKIKEAVSVVTDVPLYKVQVFEK